LAKLTVTQGRRRIEPCIAKSELISTWQDQQE
jgi:hypothetical protein